MSISEGLFYIRTKVFLSYEPTSVLFYTCSRLSRGFYFLQLCSELSHGCVVVVCTYTCSRLSHA
jgi:hypothetical protein